MLIGICGYAQSGKDTLCGILAHHGLVENRYAFADPIKEICNALFEGWDDRHAFGDMKEVQGVYYVTTNTIRECKRLIRKHRLDRFNLSDDEIVRQLLGRLTLVGQHDDITTFTVRLAYKTSPREVYQLFGTEVCRTLLHDDVWVMIAPVTDVCIPDVRFPNEAAWLNKNEGTLIRIVKDDATPVRVHESESYVESLPSHVTFDNNGSMADLEDQVIEYFGLSASAPRKYPRAGDVSETSLKTRLAVLETLASTMEGYRADERSKGLTDGLAVAVSIMRGEEHRLVAEVA